MQSEGIAINLPELVIFVIKQILPGLFKTSPFMPSAINTSPVLIFEFMTGKLLSEEIVIAPESSIFNCQYELSGDLNIILVSAFTRFRLLFAREKDPKVPFETESIFKLPEFVAEIRYF